MSIIIDVSEAISPFVAANFDGECSGKQLLTEIEHAISETLNNIADIFEGLDEGIEPSEVPEMVENNYFALASYTDTYEEMEPDTIMSAELFETLLKEISIHRQPDNVPTRCFTLIGLNLLKVEMREHSDDDAMREWESNHAIIAEEEPNDPFAPVQLCFDFY